MIKSLTSLRGIFILFIFLHHCKNIYPGGGTMAVTFFFVLGGFVMTLGYKDKVIADDFNYKQYLTRRCIKFYPLHWLCLLLSIPWAMVLYNWKYTPVFFINALLLHSWVPISSISFSFNPVSWYLADTMFFAVVFPLLYKAIVKTAKRVKWLIALFFVILYVMVALLMPSGMQHEILYISPYMRLTDFVFGIFLALVYCKIKEKQDPKLSGNILWGGVVFLIILLLVLESCWLSNEARLYAPIYWVPVAAIILITSLVGDNLLGRDSWMNKILYQLGEMSFTVYMVHMLVLIYSNLFITNKIVYVIFTFVVTIVLSILIERFFLKPITQWLTKRNSIAMIAR